MSSSQVTLTGTSPLTPTSTKHRSKLFTSLRGMLRRRRCDNVVVGDQVPPPLPVDAASTIKRARRQTYVMHSAPSLEVPKPTPVLTLSSHHLVVCQKDRRELAHRYSHLASIPEYYPTTVGVRDAVSVYSSSSSFASSASSSSLSTRSLEYPVGLMDSPHSHWSDDSSDELDSATTTSKPCECQDLTFTKLADLCPACSSQDVPEDEALVDSDVDSLLESYFGEEDDVQDPYHRERWREFSTTSSSVSSSSASTHYDPLFSPRSSSTTFTVASPRLYKSRPETPVDIRDFDMILTSSPPSPHGVRFNRASIDARDALIAESRRKRISTGTV
ncbi:hypothetical protein JCM3766R1_002850 [Sporobolomyces carnicolor]